jgi:hypothetical protein
MTRMSQLSHSLNPLYGDPVAPTLLPISWLDWPSPAGETHPMGAIEAAIGLLEEFGQAIEKAADGGLAGWMSLCSVRGEIVGLAHTDFLKIRKDRRWIGESTASARA